MVIGHHTHIKDKKKVIVNIFVKSHELNSKHLNEASGFIQHQCDGIMN